MAHRVLYDCEDRPRAWANNADAYWLGRWFSLWQTRSIDIQRTSAARRVAQSCSPLITREYFLISVFSLAPSLRPSSATNAPYRQRSRKYHYSYARGLLLRARNFNKLKCLSARWDLCRSSILFYLFLNFSLFSFLTQSYRNLTNIFVVILIFYQVFLLHHIGIKNQIWIKLNYN